MSTATAAPAAPSLTTPGPNASWLAKAGSILGIVMVAGAVALTLAAPANPAAQALAHSLLPFGTGLVGTCSVIYGGYTSALKYVAMAKQYEPEADAVAALIPGAAGTDIRFALGLLEKAINVIAVSSPVDPAALAKVVGASATPSASGPIAG